MFFSAWFIEASKHAIWFTVSTPARFIASPQSTLRLHAHYILTSVSLFFVAFHLRLLIQADPDVRTDMESALNGE